MFQTAVIGILRPVMDTIAYSRSTKSGRFAVGPFRFVGMGLLLALAGCGSFAAQGRNSEGVRLYQQSQYQQALRQFQEATYADPSNPNGYYNMAATYHSLGKLERRQTDLAQAENYYNMCLDRNADHVECYRGLAVLLAEQGRKDEAFRLLEGWVQRQPRLADARVELARLNDEYGNRQAAQDILIEALAVDPKSTRALSALGKIREDAGDVNQALANYQRSYNLDNRQPQVAARLAALQGGVTPGGVDASGGPAVELGTRIADRSTETPR